MEELQPDQVTPEEEQTATAPPEEAAEAETAGPPAVEAAAASEPVEPTPESEPAVSMDDLLAGNEPEPTPVPVADTQLLAVLEAIVYVADEPLMLVQIASALGQPAERVRALMEQLITEFDKPEHGVSIREVAGGYKMATKAEHHEAVRSFVKSLKPPLKLSLPALETLAVIAYKQPVTAPEIMEIRGVRGAGVVSTLLERKLIAQAGRKNVIGKPMMYKTTKEFLIQFGLKDLSELPSLKEFEEIRRMAFADEPVGEALSAPADETPQTASPVSEPAAGEAEASEPEPAPQESNG